MIRYPRPDDYEIIAEMISSFRPDYPRTKDDLLRADETRPLHCKHRYLIAEHDSKVIGYGMYTQYADIYHPDQYHIQIFIKEGIRRRGIGKQLLSELLNEVHENAGTTVYCRLTETDESGLAFASKNGFIESSRRIESLLKLDHANLESLSARLEKLAESDIIIQTFSDLNDTQRDQKMYDIHTTVDAQVPMETPITPLPYPAWRKSVIDHPQFLADGSFIAIHKDEYIGVSTQFSFVPKIVYVELTGTRDNYRHRGIATTLKLSGIKYAKEAGFEYVGVTNDYINTGILAVNEKLGFQQTKIVINMKLDL